MTDPHIDGKDIVQQGYDRCAAAYLAARRGESNPELQLLIQRLSPGDHILDIGCGAGVPIANTLASQFRVTGVDISAEQIRLARQNVPAAIFIQADIMSLEFPPATFNAVIAFYAIFHLPREEHALLFKRIAQWLKPGGYIMATLSRISEAAYTENDFFDVTMYWSNFGLQEYLRMLARLGFTLLDTSSISHGYHDDPERPSEQHPLILAQARTMLES